MKRWKEFAQALIDYSTEETLIIISYENRSDIDAGFFPYIKSKKFSVQKVSDDDLDEFWRCDDISIFH